MIWQQKDALLFKLAMPVASLTKKAKR